MTDSNSAASRTLAAIGPAVSWLWLMGTMCVRLDQPDRRLQPDDAVDRGRAGDRAIGFGADREPDDAGGDRGSASARRSARDCGRAPTGCGSGRRPRSSPKSTWFERMFAHSLRLVLPRITAPAERSRATSGASRPVTLLASARLPAVVGSGPAASILSLIRIGWPAITLSARPLASKARAWSIAVGSSAITAWIRGRGGPRDRAPRVCFLG